MADDNNVFELFSEVLDKLIETQVASAKATSELQTEVQSTNEHLKEVHKLLADVNAHFSNGFRSELKTHITKELDDIQTRLEEKSQKDKKGVETILSSLELLTNKLTALFTPWTLVKAFVFVAGLFGVIAAIVTVVLKLMGTT